MCNCLVALGLLAALCLPPSRADGHGTEEQLRESVADAIESAAGEIAGAALTAAADSVVAKVFPAGLLELLEQLQASGDLSAAGAQALTGWAAGLVPLPVTDYTALATELLAGRAVSLSGLELPSAGGAARSESVLPDGDYLLRFEGVTTVPELEVSLKQLLDDTEALAARLRRIDSLPAAAKMLKLRELDPSNLSLKLQLGKGLSISRSKPKANAAAAEPRSLTLLETAEGWELSGSGFSAEELAEMQSGLADASQGRVVLSLPAAPHD